MKKKKTKIVKLKKDATKKAKSKPSKTHLDEVKEDLIELSKKIEEHLDKDQI